MEIAAGQLGRIEADGEIVEFSLPDRAARPHAIVADPDGGAWFTEWGANRIGRIDPTGRIEGWALPTPNAEPHGITRTPTGIWAALEIGAIAHLTPPTPA